MPSTNVSVSMSAGGVSISGSKTRTADAAKGYDLAVPGAKTGSLTTRTNTTAGEMTLEASHGINTADVIDMYWDGGYRTASVVGTVAGTAVPFSGGAGDDLPLANTDMKAAPRLDANVLLDGSNIKLLGIQAVNAVAGTNEFCHIDFEDAGANSAVKMLIVTNEPKVIDVEGGDTNDFTGETIETAKISTSHTDVVQLRIAALVDATP